MKITAIGKLIGVCISPSMLLSACGPQPAPTAAPTAPIATGKACEGVRIVFFPGGYAACPFGTILHNGAATAAEHLGADVKYMSSDWDPDKMARQFKEAIATEPDGIAVMGLPGDDALAAAIDEARAKGIIVTSQNVIRPRAEAKYKGEGFAYAGQEMYEAGYALGEEAIRRTGFGAGDRAMVWGSLSVPTLGQRTQGILDALEEAGMTVDYIEIDPATDADYYGAGPPIFAEYVASHPDVKLVATDHGGLTEALPAYLEAAGKGPDDTYTTKWQFSGMHIDTGGGFVHKDNVEVLAPLVEQQIR